MIWVFPPEDVQNYLLGIGVCAVGVHHTSLSSICGLSHHCPDINGLDGLIIGGERLLLKIPLSDFPGAAVLGRASSASVIYESAYKYVSPLVHPTEESGSDVL